MSSVFIDVTDLVEFLERQESVSGVQRVVVEVAPLLVERPHVVCVLLDRSRGVFVELTEAEKQTLIDHGVRNGSTYGRVILATVSSQCLERARNADSVEFNDDSVLVFLGALWINDALMIAARAAHATGARIVSLLYDLTPILDTGHTAAVWPASRMGVRSYRSETMRAPVA